LEPSTSDREITILLQGEYDLARAADLRHALLDISVRGPNVTADLSGVTFMDSSALRALLEVRNTLMSEDGSLRLTSVPDSVGVLLDITGMADLFGVDATATL
jgi:anti-sigma B factor antagonist